MTEKAELASGEHRVECIGWGTLDHLDQLVGRGELVRKLRYEVREGGEADEVMIVPQAFIANRNSSFILQLIILEEE